MGEGDGRLDGKVAVVTGGAGGIGRATGGTLWRAGAHLVLADRDPDILEPVRAELRAAGEGAGEILTVAGDVRRAGDAEALARSVLDRFGRIDMLITCAGILRAPGTLPKPLHEVTPEEWDAVLDVNLKGVYLTNRAVLPTMIAQRGGVIVNVSSTSGRQGKAHDAPYCASKFGVIGFSEAVAEEVRRYGVKVLTILPDAVETPLWNQNGPIKPDFALAPERVADLILYMVTLPEDTVITAPVIAPFRTRRRRPERAPAAAKASETAG